MPARIVGIGERVLVRDGTLSRAATRRWAAALATVRGVAVLRLLGQPEEAVERQWSNARRHAVGGLRDQ